MTTDIKLVLTDLDGTVVGHAYNIVSDANLQACRDVEAAGVSISAVTGRPFQMALPILRQLGLTQLSVFNGGAVVADALTGEVVWERTIGAEIASKCVTLLQPVAEIIDYGDGHIAAAEVNPAKVVANTFSIWAAIPTEQGEQLQHIIQTLPDVVAHLNQRPWGRQDVVGIQITHAEADKEHGVRALLDILGVQSAHTLAIGDGSNDLPLFHHANVKVAMGNAEVALRTAANHVVSTVEVDGWAEAMRKYVLK